ncbi:MAG: choice-of-anchor I family protein [Spirosoma sp.]|nr:choice-of-anchor I family protein [Spirosoma sp.]
MKKLYLCFLLFLPLLSLGQLAPGSIAFTGFNADGNDNLNFVALDAIPVNTTIFFRDDEWQNPGFNTGESIIVWNSGGSVVPAGTVVAFSNINPSPATPIVVSVGSASITGNRGISNENDAVFAYLGTNADTPTTFLGAISNNGVAANTFGTLVGTGLAVGATALSLTGEIAVAIYTGPRTGISRSCYPAVLNNAVNWLVQPNSSGDQSIDGIAPDLPFSTSALTFGSSCPLPTVAFSTASRSVGEASGTLSVTLVITSPGSTTGAVQLALGSASAQNGTDFILTGAPVTVSIPASMTSVVYRVPLVNDGLPEADEYLTLRLLNGSGVQIGAVNSQLVFILDDDKKAPAPSPNLNLQLLTSYRNPTAGSSEIVAYEKTSKRLFIANSVANRIDIVNFANPSAPVALTSINVALLGGSINSVATQDGLIAAAIENTNKVLPGKIVFFDPNGQILKEVTAGALPDMIGFSPDGRFVVTADEGEPNDDYSADPEGSVTVVDISGGIASLTQSNVSIVRFTAFNDQKASLRSAGVRLYGRKGNVNDGSSVAEDLEPEYVTFSPDSKTVYVTLQENNALAIIDLTTKTATAIKPLGLKNHNTDANPLDPTDQGTTLALQKLPVFGMYEPDAIATFTSGGQSYLITANEGDAREYAALSEVVRVGAAGYVLDPTVFPNAADLKNNLLLGRLNVTNQSGDLDGDGDFDQIHTLGARSFTVWDMNANLVWDSGDQLERITRDQAPLLFNSSNTAGNPAQKNRSDDKGPEPEGVTTANINGRVYAFIGLERIGGVMVYDVTTPTAPQFVTYSVNRTAPTATAATDDRGAEGIIYISAADSPNGKGLVLLANEISNSVSVYQINTSVNSLSMATPTYNCATGLITYNPIGGDGSTITFQTPGITSSGPTSLTGMVQAGLRGDPKPITITATQSGRSVSVTFDFAAFCAGQNPGSDLALLAPNYDCSTGAISFVTVGGDGSPITFFAPGIRRMSDTNPDGVVEAGLRDDPKPLFIQATQGNHTVTTTFDFAAFCVARARKAAVDAEVAFEVTVQGNPTSADYVRVSVRGAGGQPLRLTVRDVQGRVVSDQSVELADTVEQQNVGLGRTSGMYMLQVKTPTMSRTVKVVRQ